MKTQNSSRVALIIVYSSSSSFLSLSLSHTHTHKLAIDFLWHDHPLELRSLLTDAQALCFVCLQPVSGYSFRCPKCNFFLHLSCLKLPLESQHPLHRHHPLTLLSEPPLGNDGCQLLCDDCKNLCFGFTYYCAACPYTLHLQCASKQRAFKLKIHKHLLTFSASQPSGFETFRCNVCGDVGNGFSLCCKSCEFAVHVECSALPVTVKREQDEHPFVLAATRSIDDEPDEVYCDVCEERVNPNGCVYYCAQRCYIAHLGCLTSASKPHIKLSYRDVDLSSAEASEQTRLEIDHKVFDDRSGLRSDPIDDAELAKLRHRLSQQQMEDQGQSSQVCDESKLQSNEEDPQLAEPIHPKTKHNVVELEHFSHQHPLTLNNDHEKDNLACCFGCWGRISGLAYGCTQCKFFLHRWCAELPSKVQHPIHPLHSLTLLSMPPSHNSACVACDEPCDGFTYSCTPCYFNLHAMCASIPSTLRNEIHQHPLTLHRKTPYSTRCKACSNDCTGTVFQCDACNLGLDFKCALLTHTVRHKCHLDPLTLTSLPVEDDSDEFYCDACEERRDPNHWVYYCADCEYIAHMNCVFLSYLEVLVHGACFNMTSMSSFLVSSQNPPSVLLDTGCDDPLGLLVATCKRLPHGRFGID